METMNFTLDQIHAIKSLLTAETPWWKDWLIPLISAAAAILGACVGGRFSIKAIEYEKKQSKKERVLDSFVDFSEQTRITHEAIIKYLKNENSKENAEKEYSTLRNMALRCSILESEFSHNINDILFLFNIVMEGNSSVVSQKHKEILEKIPAELKEQLNFGSGGEKEDILKVVNFSIQKLITALQKKFKDIQ
jgi:hypothetical protein